MIRRPPRSTRTDTSFPTLRASDLSHAAPALAADWLVNDTDGGPAILHQRDKRAEDRPPGDEAAGAVNRIENPDAPGIFPDDAIFLAHDAVIGPLFLQYCAHGRFSGAISLGHRRQIALRFNRESGPSKRTNGITRRVDNGRASCREKVGDSG